MCTESHVHEERGCAGLTGGEKGAGTSPQLPSRVARGDTGMRRLELMKPKPRKGKGLPVF